jgi:hypothetical protein
MAAFPLVFWNTARRTKIPWPRKESGTLNQDGG